MALAAAVVLFGVLAAVLGARAVARSEATKARLAFHLSSQQIASRLKLAIQHEEDLVVSASAFVSGSTRVSPVAFDRWVQSVQALRRYPELENIGLVALVPASQLQQFVAGLVADPVRPFGPQSVAPERFRLLPVGARPYYCIARAGMARSAASYIPPGLDYCAFAPTLITTRDTGQASYAPFVLTKAILGISTPVYREGAVPATVAARRRKFVGWLGELIMPDVVLDNALAGYPKYAVRFTYSLGPSHVAFSSGGIPASAQKTTIDLHNGWTVQSFAPAVAAAIFAYSYPTLTLIAGTLLSLLFGLLLLVLATGRRRALALVQEKTRALSHQASHDALTGLPSRALVIERAEQMLVGLAERPDAVVSALFIDVDDFKRINDTLGHAAGDELLQVVASRLQNVAREGDTVGRLAGDEFVALAQLSLRDATGPERTIHRFANRVTEVLGEPVAIEGGCRLLSVTASVGAAVGRYETPDALLRDADLALYAAKAAGKDRYMLFEATMRERAAGPLVLVADDDEISAAVAQALLAKRGLRANLTHDGLRALQMALANNYAAILMDCRMPGLDGYECTQRIRAEGLQMPIIAMTANSIDDDDRERCMSAGMNDYLTKPICDDRLDAVIERWVTKSAPEESVDPIDNRAAGISNGASHADGASEEPSEMVDAATVQQLRKTLPIEVREQLIDSFEKSLSERVAEMADAARREDEIELKRLAHLLKGTSAMIGANGLKLTCEQLESSSANATPTARKQQLEQLRALATEARGALRRRLL